MEHSLELACTTLFQTRRVLTFPNLTFGARDWHLLRQFIGILSVHPSFLVCVTGHAGKSALDKTVKTSTLGE